MGTSNVEPFTDILIHAIEKIRYQTKHMSKSNYHNISKEDLSIFLEASYRYLDLIQ